MEDKDKDKDKDADQRLHYRVSFNLEALQSSGINWQLEFSRFYGFTLKHRHWHFSQLWRFNNFSKRTKDHWQSGTLFGHSIWRWPASKRHADEPRIHSDDVMWFFNEFQDPKPRHNRDQHFYCWIHTSGSKFIFEFNSICFPS